MQVYDERVVMSRADQRPDARLTVVFQMAASSLRGGRMCVVVWASGRETTSTSRGE